MSVLLEALKRAALEKKGKPAVGEQNSSAGNVDEAPSATAQPSQPGTDPETPADAALDSEHHPEDFSDFEVLDEEEWDQHEELDIDTAIADASEIGSDRQETQTPAALPHETDDITSPVRDQEMELHDTETLQALSGVDATSSHDVEDALKLAAEKLEREQNERAAHEASKRDAERVAYLAQQKELAASQERESQKSGLDQEPIEVVEQIQEQEQEQEQEQLGRDLEIAQQTEHLEVQQRQSEAEQQAESQVRGEKESVLTRLVHEGHELNRRQKRRSRFLYAMLVITAVGGIVSYYFYLLGNNSLQQLLTKRQANQEVVSLIGSGESEVRQAPEMTDAPGADASEQMLQETLPQETRSQNATSQLETISTLSSLQSAVEQQRQSRTVDYSSQTGSVQSTEKPRDNALAKSNAPVSVVSQGEPSSGIETVRRADQPPSANLIFNQFTRMNTTSGMPVAVARGDDPIPSRVDNLSINSDQLDTRTERVHIYHEATPTHFSDLIQQAYAAYQNGNLDRAGRYYDEALNLDPRNRDALLGGAAVASARGDVEIALRLYQLRLSEDPNDSYARAGLLTLSNYTTLETEAVDELLSTSPGAAHLHFLKGAIYAARTQWQEAQAAFFEAHHWDKENPDYAYNLAVSLDHLDQAAPAVRFYQRALQLSGSRQAGFSENSVRQRLAELGEVDG